VLANTGEAPSIHYQVNLEFPVTFGHIAMSNKQWRNATQRMNLFYFGSTSEFISFPTAPVDLGEIEFQDAPKLPDVLVINYRIYSDRGDHVQDRLVIRFTTPTSQHDS
jgi:hypothetical protein